MASQPNTDSTAAVATSDDSAPALLNCIVLGALLLGGSLAGMSFVVASGISPAPVDDEFCACSRYDDDGVDDITINPY